MIKQVKILVAKNYEALEESINQLIKDELLNTVKHIKVFCDGYNCVAVIEYQVAVTPYVNNFYNQNNK